MWIATPVILCPPDFLVSDRFAKATYDQAALDEAVRNNTVPPVFTEGKKILGFYSTGCPYCKLQATRLAVLFEKSDIDPTDAGIIFAGDKAEAAAEFFILTQSPPVAYDTLAVQPFLNITKGRMPLVLLIENGDVAAAMTYRTFDEAVVKAFFKPEN